MVSFLVDFVQSGYSPLVPGVAVPPLCCQNVLVVLCHSKPVCSMQTSRRLNACVDNSWHRYVAGIGKYFDWANLYSTSSIHWSSSATSSE